MTIEDLSLLFTRGLGSRSIYNLIETFGSAEAVVAASHDDLVWRAGLRPDVAERIVRKEGLSLAKEESLYARRHHLAMISATDPEYPVSLKAVQDRPHVLFVRGNVDALSLPSLAMVGTREMSPAGQNVCNRLVEGLSKSVPNLCIVSGLAYGVDSACHRAAISYNLKTVAVVASVLPDVTPAPHRALAEDIVRNGGAIVSELHSQTHQNGSLFIARNRIIAGIAHGTLVVESPASGGSLATADIADSYGRVVMAVPGRMTDVSSFGCNNLIRTGRARLVLTASDIIEDVGFETSAHASRNVEVPTSVDFTMLAPKDRVVYEIIASNEVTTFTEVLNRSKLSIGDVTMTIMSLELQGLVRTLPGQRYEKI
jgi:DNA processing protein